MSRGFISGGGDGGKKSGAGAKSKFGKLLGSTRVQTREEMIKGKSSHGTRDYSEMLEDLIDEKMFSGNPNKYKFTLAGTEAQEDREMTKGMKAAMEMAMMQRAKKRNKERGAKIEIIPKSFGMGAEGGRLTKEGKVMNNAGQILLSIDPKTGIITDGFGLKVGKYSPNSAVCDTKIEKLIQKYTRQKSKFNPFAAKE